MARTPGIVMLIGFLLIGVAAMFGSRQYPQDSYLATGLFIGGILIIFSAAISFSYVKGASRLYLAPKGSELSFWQRNKDKIIMLAVGGVLTEAIHLILSHHQEIIPFSRFPVFRYFPSSCQILPISYS